MKRPTAQGGRRGTVTAFTLLEVMIVIGMAALVMAISIPFVQRTIRRDAIFTAVKVIEDACQNARAQAIMNNSTAELVILPEDKRVSVQAGASHGTHPRRRAAAAAASAANFSAAAAPDDPSGRPKPAPGFGRQAPPPFSGHLGDDVVIQLLDVNFVEHSTDKEARVRFQPNGTSDEFTIVLRIGASAVRQINLDIVTGFPVVKVIR